MNYLKIDKGDVSNGIGIGVVLWVAGCSCHCKNCHNQSAWDFNAGTQFTDNTMQELLHALDKPYISRLTLSGGHPLDPKNLDVVYKIICTIRNEYPNKSIWLYTGYTWEEILEQDKLYKDLETNAISPLDVVKLCDVLVDGRYEDDKRDISLAWRGSTNQRVINIKESLKQGKIDLYCE